MPIPLRLSLLLGLSLFLASSEKSEQLPETSGVKITVQFVAGETSNEERVYIQADRRRTEYRNAFSGVHGDGTLDTRPGPQLASIERCDLGQGFELNPEDREYVAFSYPRFKPTKQQIEARTDNILQKVAPWVPTIREERTTVDTGEKKNFFGHEARHVIETQKTIPLAGSHSEPQEWVTDGWYIDLDRGLSCDVKWPPFNVGRRHEYFAAGGERYEVIDDGTRRVTGFAIERKYTSRSTVLLPDGTKRPTAYTNEVKITEFYEGPLDAALFEVPPGFRKVSDLRRDPPMTLADRWYYTGAWLKSVAKSIF
jgi:hypothetical protein